MSNLERITITLTPELASGIRNALTTGGYASTSEIVREALRDWNSKRAREAHQLAEMRAFLEPGLKDEAEGRVGAFDPEAIKAQGRRASRADSP